MFLTMKGLGMTLLVGLLLAGCSDDSSPTEPDTNPVNSVIINPTEATFDAIGQSKQFTAKAYNETGGEVSTTFSWSSSNEDVVMIGSDVSVL